MPPPASTDRTPAGGDPSDGDSTAGDDLAGDDAVTGSHGAPSFLDRKRWGLSHWLLIAMATLFVLGFVPRGLRKAIESNVNKAEDWLPKNYPESNDLRWFAQHFVGAKFVLASWEGATIGEADAMARVVQRLNAMEDGLGAPVFTRVLTGPEQVASLTREPSNLRRSDAIQRLEGALVGPPQLAQSEAEALTDDPAEVASLRDASRTTCLVAYMSEYVTDSNARMRSAIEEVAEIVQDEVGVPYEQVHLGGPTVDNVTIDIEGEKTLLRLAGFSGLVGFALSFWCFRSLRLTWFVFSVSGISAGVSLAIVYWYGVLEINALGYATKRLGTVDAILMSMPAVVYVLGLSGAIHIVNYYRDERDARGVKGAAERGVRIGWGPCALAALTTAVGLGSLGASEIIPIKKFGVFSAAGVLATVGVLLAILPVSLHLFPPKLPGDDPKNPGAKPAKKKPKHGAPLPAWAAAHARFVTHRYHVVTFACLAAMAFFAYGLTRTDTEVRLLKLLDPGTKLISDYKWFEAHLGNLVPMEVVITLDDDQLRSPDELKPNDAGTRYRMSMHERVQLVSRIQERIESLGPVSRAMSAATFGPAEREVRRPSERLAVERATSNALEESRDALAEYLARETPQRGTPPPADARELWRISARVAAIGDGSGDDIDYGHFVVNLQRQVEPVLDVYRLRDKLLARLHERGRPFVGARVVVLFDAAADLKQPPEGSDEALLVKLLIESGVKWKNKGRAGAVTPFNAATLRAASDEGGGKAEAYGRALAGYDAIVVLSPVAKQTSEAFQTYLESPATLVTLAERGADTAADRCEANAALEPDASLAAVYTGIVPLVYKTQRELLTSLTTSILYATVLIAGVMVVVLRSPGGGLVSMIPNVFPVVSVFGTLGWLGIKIDIGIMMTASVALGVAVDDTIHFLTWFRRGIVRGLDRRSATLLAFDRCAVAMTQTTLIAGLGLAVFATSTFTPTQQFGYLMITMLGAALVGDLVMLPAILCGPLGRFFAPGTAAAPAPVVDAAPPAAPEAAGPPTPAAADAATVPLNGPGTVNASPLPAGAADAADESTAEDAAAVVGATPHSSPEPLSPSNAALHAKLQKFRRP
ncbi:MAG: MMPL family transporter [Planctomycetota bacterium]